MLVVSISKAGSPIRNKNPLILLVALFIISLLSACGPKEENTVVNNFAVAPVSYTVEEVSVSQSQYFGNLSGSFSTNVFEIVVSARADISISSFDFEINAGGSLSFSDPILINELGNVAGVSVPIGHFQHRITLNSPLSLQAGESSSFSVIFEVFADPGRTGVLQATLTNVAAVSQGAVVDFISPITGPLVIFEGAPAQVVIEALPVAGQYLAMGSEQLLRVKITAIEDVVLQGVDVIIYKNSGVEIQNTQVLNAQGSELGSYTYPFQTLNENYLRSIVHFNTGITLRGGESVEIEYRVITSFTDLNLSVQAVLNGLIGVVTSGPVFGPLKQS